MATKKSTIVIISLLTLVIGYVVGAFVGLPSINSDRISGDIGKVNRHKALVVSEEEALMEQKLRTDSTFMAQTTYTLAFLSARIGEFKENAVLTADVSARYPEMQKYQEPMANLASIATNAQLAASSALVALGNISNGEEGSSYEEFSNNALLSYLLLEKGLSVSADFVSDADAFLKGKRLVDFQTLAFVRDMWANYNLVSAVLNEDNALVTYWNKSGYKLSPEQTKLAFGNSPAAFQNSAALSYLFNGQILSNASSRLGAHSFSMLNNDRLGLANNEKLGRVIRVITNTGALEVFLSHDTVFRNQTLISFSSAQLGAAVKIGFSDKALGSSVNLSGSLNSRDLFGVSSRLGAVVRDYGMLNSSRLGGIFVPPVEPPL